MIEVKELSESELRTVTGGRGVWDKEGIRGFAKELIENYPGKVIGMPLESMGKSEGFYNKFYKGTHKIKYISYYCRKYLLEAFQALEIAADVRTNKNTILVQLKSQSKPDEDSEELEEGSD
jgi:bacteriocin-like protein